MRFQAGIQVLLLVVAVIIVVTVVRPKFAEIQFNQNEVVGYRSALAQAGGYNERVAVLLNEARSIPIPARQALNTYLPTEINATQVSRDIENILALNNLFLVELAAEEMGDVTVTNPDESDRRSNFVRVDPETTEIVSGLIAQRFIVNAIGTYDQLKSSLQDFERNAYPLRLVELELQTQELSPINEYTIVLEAYALKELSN